MDRPDRQSLAHTQARVILVTFWLATLLVAGAPAQAAGAGPSTHVSVKPGSGNPRTRFMLSLRIPEATGTFGSVVRRDTLSVSGPRGGRCVSSVTVRLRSAKRGARLTLTLRPASLGTGGWCTGEFNGRVVQREVLRCPPRPVDVCPDFLLAPRTIARFRFHVAPGNAGGSAGPGPPAPADRPTFAGLVSATTCNSFAPEVLPRPSGYILTWQAATDPVTASSAIVYDIYVATAPGGENYAQPSWTTQPGVTSFTTPALGLSGPIYFVVRARNAAGNEDGNTVERQGVSQCGGPPRNQPAAR